MDEEKINLIKNAQNGQNEAILIEADSNIEQDLLLNYVANILNNGVKIIQFYSKNLSDFKNIEIAHKLRQLCSIFNALLIINSRIDIAQLVKADGICLFDGDITSKQVKSLTHDDLIIAMHIDNFKSSFDEIKNDIDYICFDSINKTRLNVHNNTLNDMKLIELDRYKI